MIPAVITLSLVALSLSYMYSVSSSNSQSSPIIPVSIEVSTGQPTETKDVNRIYANINNEEDFINHMIPHHQVAIDMCNDYAKKTTDPNMTYLCQRIAWQQGYEIFIMKNLMKTLEISYDPIKGKSIYQKTVFEYYEPDVANPSLGNAISQLMLAMNDTEFMNLMIPHHQIAVNMCKSILKITPNFSIVTIAYDIIKEEEKQISMMKAVLKSKTLFKYDSDLL
jgi:uncharacterized protein (DUF305 family)